MKFLSKLKYFHWQICVWKCRLPKWRPSCPDLNVLIYRFSVVVLNGFNERVSPFVTLHMSYYKFQQCQHEIFPLKMLISSSGIFQNLMESSFYPKYFITTNVKPRLTGTYWFAVVFVHFSHVQFWANLVKTTGSAVNDVDISKKSNFETFVLHFSITNLMSILEVTWYPTIFNFRGYSLNAGSLVVQVSNWIDSLSFYLIFFIFYLYVHNNNINQKPLGLEFWDFALICF